MCSTEPSAGLQDVGLQDGGATIHGGLESELIAFESVIVNADASGP